MFNKTVASICSQFTTQLEQVQAQQDTLIQKTEEELDVLQSKVEEARRKQNAAREEKDSAGVAMDNIRTLFGQ